MHHVVELFYGAHCLGCPEARQAVQLFAARRLDVVVIEHDVEAEAALELARRYRLIATPALVIDGEAVIYGVPSPSALEVRLAEGRPAASPDARAR